MAKIEEQILNNEVASSKDPVADTPPTGDTSFDFIKNLGQQYGIQQDSGIGREQSASRKDLDLEHYHADIQYGEDFDKVAEENQTGWDLLKASTVNVVSEIGLGTMAGVADLLDVPNWVNLMTGSGEVFDSVLSDLSKSLNETKEEISQGAGKVYGGDDFDPGNPAWWAKNAGSMASTLTLLIPSSAAVRGLGALSKVFRASNVGRKMVANSKLVRAVAYAAKSGTRSAHMAEAIISRIGENTMEARGVYDDTYRKVYEAKVKELGEDKAKEAAIKAATGAASTTWQANSAMVLQDMLAYDSMYKAMAKMKKGKAAAKALTKGETKVAKAAAAKATEKAAKEAAKGIGGTSAWGKAYKGLSKITKAAAPLGSSAIGEGMEEGYQYIIGEEAKRYALDNADVLKDDRPFDERMLSYLDSDEFKTSVAMGAIGGVLFSGIGEVRKTMAAHEEDKRNTAKASTLAMEMSAYLNNKDTYDKAKRNVFVGKALEKLKSGDLEVMREDLKMKAEATDADLTADGYDNIPKFRKDVQRSLEDLDTIERIHEDVEGDNSIPADLKPMLTMSRASKIVLEGTQKDIKKHVTDITETLSTNGVKNGLKGAAEYTKAINTYAKESATGEEGHKFEATKKALEEYNALAKEEDKVTYSDFVKELKKMDTTETLINLHKADAYIENEFTSILEAEELLKSAEGHRKLRAKWVSKMTEAVKQKSAEEAKEATETLDATDMDVAEVDPADTNAETTEGATGEEGAKVGESKFTKQANSLVAVGEWEALQSYIQKGIEVQTEEGKAPPTEEEIIKKYGINFTTAQRKSYNKATSFEEVAAEHAEKDGHFATDRLPEGTTSVKLDGVDYDLSEPAYKGGKPGTASPDVIVVTGPKPGDKKVFNKNDIVFGTDGKYYFVTGLAKKAKDEEYGSSLYVKKASRKGDTYYMKESVQKANATRLPFDKISNRVKRKGSDKITVARQPIFHPNYKHSIEVAKSRKLKAELANGVVSIFNYQYVDLKNHNFTLKDNPLDVDFYAAGNRLVRGENDTATLERVPAGEAGNPLEQDVILLKQGDTVLGSMVYTDKPAAFNNAMYALGELGNKVEVTINSKSGTIAYAHDEEGKKITTSLQSVAGMREHPNGKVTILRVMGNNKTDRTAISADGTKYETNFSDSAWNNLTSRANHGKTAMVLQLPGGTDYFEILGDAKAKDAIIDGEPAPIYINRLLEDQEAKFTEELNTLIDSSWERLTIEQQATYGTKAMYAKTQYYDDINNNKATDTELWKNFVGFKNSVLDGYVRHVSPYTVNKKGKKSTNTADNRYFDYTLKVDKEGKVVMPIKSTYQQKVITYNGIERIEALNDRVLAVRDEQLDSDPVYREAVFNGGWVNCLQPQDSSTYMTNINIDATSPLLAVEGDIVVDGASNTELYTFEVLNDLKEIYAEAKDVAVEDMSNAVNAVSSDSVTYEQDVVEAIKGATKSYAERVIENLKGYKLSEYITGIDNIANVLGTAVNNGGELLAEEFYTSSIRDSEFTGEDSSLIINALSKMFSVQLVLENAVSANTIVANRKTAEEAKRKLAKAAEAAEKKEKAKSATTATTGISTEAAKHQTELSTDKSVKVNSEEHNYVSMVDLNTIENTMEVVSAQVYPGLVITTGTAEGSGNRVGDDKYVVVSHKPGRKGKGVKIGIKKIKNDETDAYVAKLKSDAMKHPKGSDARKAGFDDAATVYKNPKYITISKVFPVNPKVMEETAPPAASTESSAGTQYGYYLSSFNQETPLILVDAATGKFAEVIGDNVTFSTHNMADMEPVLAPDDSVDLANAGAIDLIKKQNVKNAKPAEQVATETVEKAIAPPTVQSVMQDTIYKYQLTADGAQTIGKGNVVGTNSYIIDANGNSITADTKGAFLLEEATKAEVDAYNKEIVEQGDTEDVDAVFRLYDGEVENRKATETELTWLQRVLPNIPVEQLEDIRAMKSKFGAKSWGVFNNGLITVAANAAQGTVHHEAFHAVFNMYLSNTEKAELLKEASLFKEGSARTREEFLAEQFAKYMKSPKEYAKTHRSLLAKVLKFFRKLFNFVHKAPNPSTMLDVFEKIDTGYFATAKDVAYTNTLEALTDKAVSSTSRNLGDYTSYISRLSDKDRVALKRAIQENNVEINCK